jgi:hypothetical protein
MIGQNAYDLFAPMCDEYMETIGHVDAGSNRV